MRSLKECFIHPCPPAVIWIRQVKRVASELFKRTAEKGGATSYCQSNPKHRVKGKRQGRGERVIPREGAKGKQFELPIQISDGCEWPHLEKGRMQSKGVCSPLPNFQSSEKGYSDWALNIDNKQHVTVWMASHGLFTESARAPHTVGKILCLVK